MESLILIIIFAITTVPLFILGLFIKQGKGLMLIAGYNTMSKEERDKVDKEELSRTVGNLLLRMALEIVLLGVAIYFKSNTAIIILIIVIIADTSKTVIKLNRSNPVKSSSQFGSKASPIITIIILIGIGIMFFYGENEPAVNVQDDVIKIEGLYGLDVNLSEVTKISLIESSMKEIGLGHRYNGYGGFGDTFRGNFRAEGRGNYLLFVSASSPFTIHIERENDKDIYISYKDSEKTKTLYQELITAVP